MTDFEKDYYAILESEEHASLNEIKTAYRRLVKKYHPDLHPDNKEYESKIKDINEAYDVISNPDERLIYDNFRLNFKKIDIRKDDSFSSNKKQFTRETQVKEEIRTYIKGNVQIKYCGVQNEEDSMNIFREESYKMTITEITADILASDISEGGEMPPEFGTIFNTVEPLKLPLKLPIECSVYDGASISNYAFNIQNITVPSPIIDKVTKHEGQSFGVLRGVFYGYISDFQTKIILETVTECFGETGRKETYNEVGADYFRKEYFNTNCSTYWGKWIKIEVRNTYVPTGRTESNGFYFRSEYFKSDYSSTYWGNWNYKKQTTITNQKGCLGLTSGWLFLLLLVAITFILFFPKLSFLLPIIAIPFLLVIIPYGIWVWIARLFWGGVIALYFLAILGLFFQGGTKKRFKKTGSSPVPETSVRKSVIRQKKEKTVNGDSVITHYLEWQDYLGNNYSGTYEISVNDFNSSRMNKLSIPYEATDQLAYDRIVYSLKEFDKNKMISFYKMFDSLQSHKKLNQKNFAECMVSFVQNLPYTIVLPQNCDASLYQDEFTTKYLSTPGARCDGNERFGINSPVEFITNLKGDCDTRTLLLYTMLSHYNYDVAMLSSSFYGHSLLGINMPYQGTSFPYQNSKYFLWETTTPNAQAGMIANEISDLTYWRITLKSQSQ